MQKQNRICTWQEIFHEHESTESSPKLRLHSHLVAAQKFAYEPCGLCPQAFVKEVESAEYGAFIFEMNQQRIKFRVAKITPTKIGQFVTFWKRIGKGPIMPHEIADPFDLFVVSVNNAEHFGQFVFPKTILCEKGIVSKEGKGGKRAMRVYPPWDKADNAQAKKTQAWQLKYFYEIKPNALLDKVAIQKLFLVSPQD